MRKHQSLAALFCEVWCLTSPLVADCESIFENCSIPPFRESRNGIQTASFANQFTKQNLAFNELRHFSGEVKPNTRINNCQYCT
ncbi:MAG: hypothetical protein P1P63_07665 [Treponemataceae bacterium]